MQPAQAGQPIKAPAKHRGCGKENYSNCNKTIRKAPENTFICGDGHGEAGFAAFMRAGHQNDERGRQTDDKGIQKDLHRAQQPLFTGAGTRCAAVGDRRGAHAGFVGEYAFGEAVRDRMRG